MSAEGIVPEHEAASLVAAPTFSDAVETQPETLVPDHTADFQVTELGVTSPAKIEAVMQPPPSPPLLQGGTLYSAGPLCGARVLTFLNLLAFMTVFIFYARRGGRRASVKYVSTGSTTYL